jgi:ESS family glutamate:Na+ symporter
MGKAWEALGFEHGGTIGLTFAGIGFGFGFLVGVPLVNYGIRKGMATFGPKSLPRDFLVGILLKGGKKESAGTLTLHSGNADTLALHAALVGTVYLLTYFTIIYVGRLVPPDVQPMLWGFCFMVGLAIALIVKRIITALGLDYLTDPGVQRRITGWSVDFLTIATISAIQLAVVWQFMLPISLMALTMGICTTALVVFFARRIEAYNLERMAAIYGTVTGTVACGLLLVRIVDPEFKTPAAFEVGLMNVFVVPIIGACMFLTNSPLWWDWSVATTILVFLAIAIICGTMLRVTGLWGDVKQLHDNG